MKVKQNDKGRSEVGNRLAKCETWRENEKTGGGGEQATLMRCLAYVSKKLLTSGQDDLGLSYLTPATVRCYRRNTGQRQDLRLETSTKLRCLRKQLYSVHARFRPLYYIPTSLRTQSHLSSNVGGKDDVIA